MLLYGGFFFDLPPVITGAVRFVLGYGLWKKKIWGWWGTVVYWVTGIVFVLFGMLVSHCVSSLFFLVVFLLFVYYLTEPKTGSYFGVVIPASLSLR